MHVLISDIAVLAASAAVMSALLAGVDDVVAVEPAVAGKVTLPICVLVAIKVTVAMSDCAVAGATEI